MEVQRISLSIEERAIWNRHSKKLAGFKIYKNLNIKDARLEEMPKVERIQGKNEPQSKFAFAPHSKVLVLNFFC